MALTGIQRTVLNTIASNRMASGESYIAGGAALNTFLEAPRQSEDVDVFHDTEEAVLFGFETDQKTLLEAGFEVKLERRYETFVEASISRNGEHTIVQWAYDSAFRFFPLVKHEDLGLALHPFDLATNKILALIGRSVPRDWVDMIECHARLQPIGYVMWAAAGKDPGLNPSFVLNQASRTARYTDEDIQRLAFSGNAPTAADLSARWHSALEEAHSIVDILPGQEVGTCVLNENNELLRASSTELPRLVKEGKVRYHAGSIRGAYPVVR